MKRIILTIVFTAVLVLLFNIELKANAAYSNSGEVSVQSTLTVIVEPALEQVTLSDQSYINNRTAYRDIAVGVRANQSWAFDYFIEPSELTVNQPSCQTAGTIGERNKNNDFQFIDLNCQRDLSWGDQIDQPEINVIYQVRPSL